MTAREKIEIVKQVVADVSGGYSVDDLTRGGRPAELAWARHVAMWICRDIGCHTLFGRRFKRIPLVLIGQAFGGREHATVMHACRVVNNAIDTEKLGPEIYRLRDMAIKKIAESEND